MLLFHPLLIEDCSVGSESIDSTSQNLSGSSLNDTRFLALILFSTQAVRWVVPEINLACTTFIANL